jgi:hypothetical protein
MTTTLTALLTVIILATTLSATLVTFFEGV